MSVDIDPLVINEEEEEDYDEEPYQPDTIPYSLDVEESSERRPEWPARVCLGPLRDHDYYWLSDPPEESRKEDISQHGGTEPPLSFSKRFSKCDKCRQSRIKMLVPSALLSVAAGKGDGVTCDFCGDVMNQTNLPRNVQQDQHVATSTSGQHEGGEMRNYVQCPDCGKSVLRDSVRQNQHT